MQQQQAGFTRHICRKHLATVYGNGGFTMMDICRRANPPS